MLRFHVFGIPVAVRPSFWLVALLIGFPDRGREAVARLVIWVAIVFVSVLIHELGHALLARRYGARVAITLYALGGYTTWTSGRQIGPGRRVAVAAAGSAVGIVLGGLALLGLRAGVLQPGSPLALQAVRTFVFVNLFWGILNWLPIRPLDGGHILVGGLQAVFGRRGLVIADVIFPIVAALAAYLAWRAGLVLGALLAAFMLLGEVQRWFLGRPAAGEAGPAPPG